MWPCWLQQRRSSSWTENQYNDNKCINTRLPRVICLQYPNSIDYIDITYELSTASLFDESGAMRAQTKAVLNTLKTKLQVEQSSRIQWVRNAVIVDGCAMFWTVYWPTSYTVADYIIHFMRTINSEHLERGDVYLIFDRYIGNSLKQMVRSSRSGNVASWEHPVSLHTTLPTQNVTLSIVHNNVQLIDLRCDENSNSQDNQTKLAITGKVPHW